MKGLGTYQLVSEPSFLGGGGPSGGSGQSSFGNGDGGHDRTTSNNLDQETPEVVDLEETKTSREFTETLRQLIATVQEINRKLDDRERRFSFLRPPSILDQNHNSSATIATSLQRTAAKTKYNPSPSITITEPFFLGMDRSGGDSDDDGPTTDDLLHEKLSLAGSKETETLQEDALCEFKNSTLSQLPNEYQWLDQRMDASGKRIEINACGKKRSTPVNCSNDFSVTMEKVLPCTGAMVAHHPSASIELTEPATLGEGTLISVMASRRSMELKMNHDFGTHGRNKSNGSGFEGASCSGVYKVFGVMSASVWLTQGQRIEAVAYEQNKPLIPLPFITTGPDGNCSVQVYSIQGCIPKDPAAIWNAKFLGAIVLIVRAALAKGMTWDDIARMVMDEKHSENPVAAIIDKLHYERNVITVLLNNSLDEIDDVGKTLPMPRIGQG